MVLALVSMSTLVGRSPAGAETTQEIPDPHPAQEFIRPLEDFVADEADRRAIEAATESMSDTVCAFFLDRQRRLWYENGNGRHAEENIERAAVTALLQEAAATGKPLAIVCNRTPCTTRRCPTDRTDCHARRCASVMEDIAREAAEDVPEARLIYAFTRRFEPSGHDRTSYEDLRAIARHGHEMFVARPSNGRLNQGAARLAWEIQTMVARGLLTPFGSDETTGSAVEALTGQTGGTGQTGQTGGIDLSTIELRYLAEPGDGSGVRYAFTADQAAAGQTPADGLGVAQLQSDAFFVWLSLPTSTFWVNLNPDEPDRIIDEELGRTDVGRILLQADLQMKRTVGQLIHPDTPLGADFWNQLDSGGGNETCLSFRQWIVPGEAVVREDGEGVYIMDAPLKVQLESEYFAEQGVASSMTCQAQDPAVEAHNEGVFRSLILPRVEQAVNEAPEYADLRRVHLSRVAAEWYRQRSLQGATTYGDMVDSGDIGRWTSTQPWSPRDVFDQYVESYTRGEFDVTRETRQGDWIVTNTYVYGGVDLSTILFDQMTSDELQATRPELPELVDESFTEPAVDALRGEVWLGSEAAPSPRDAPSGGDTDTADVPSRPEAPRDPIGDGDGASLGGTLAIVVIAVTILMACLLGRRASTRRRGRTPTWRA